MWDAGGVWPGRAVPPQPLNARLLARISARAPIGIAGRQAVAQELIEQAQALTPRGCSMSLALIYLIEQEQSALHATDRVRGFLRWGMTCDYPGADAMLLEARARRQMQRAYSCASLALGERYQLDALTSAPLDAILQGEARARRLVELRHAPWSGPSDWMVPLHAQPTLDLLLTQPDFAAIQFTVALPALPAEDEDERDAVEGDTLAEVAEIDADAVEAPVDRAFTFSVAALGAATNPAALRLLAREMRGHGALSLPGAAHAEPPLARACGPLCDADVERMACNLIYPATQLANPADAVTYTMQEAAAMLPLQFKLLE